MRMVITFDEMKPHWALQSGLDKKAEGIGFKNVKVTGDFDAKITHIYGDVDNVPATRKAFETLGWDGTLSRVCPTYGYNKIYRAGNYLVTDSYNDRCSLWLVGVEAAGDTLEEMLDNVLLYFETDHGGEGPEWNLGDMPTSIYDMVVADITAAFKAQTNVSSASAQTNGGSKGVTRYEK